MLTLKDSFWPSFVFFYVGMEIIKSTTPAVVGTEGMARILMKYFKVDTLLAKSAPRQEHVINIGV